MLIRIYSVVVKDIFNFETKLKLPDQVSSMVFVSKYYWENYFKMETFNGGVEWKENPKQRKCQWAEKFNEELSWPTTDSALI